MRKRLLARSSWYCYFFCAVLLIPLQGRATGEIEKKETYPIPRTIIALYSGKDFSKIRLTRIHRFAEMPLNHLGLKLEYHDVQEPLPDLSKRPDVRGVLTWFLSGVTLKDPIAYLEWLKKVIDLGKILVIMGDTGLVQTESGEVIPTEKINELFSKIGFEIEDNWIQLTYDMDFTYSDPFLLDYERGLAGVHPPFSGVSIIKSDTVSHLTGVQRHISEVRENNLIVTSPRGAYVADGYGFYYDEPDNITEQQREHEQWILNPFEFFRMVYHTDDIPKPDTTTLAGRRIYYSHIDGDGWNNVTRVDQYRSRGKDTLSSEVIMDKVIVAHPGLPVTVAPIAADIDPSWVGTKESIRVAKEIFDLPQVEVASHTYSHPFYWEFFENYSTEKEKPFLFFYPYGGWHKPNVFEQVLLRFHYYDKAYQQAKKKDADDYDLPRGFANHPFNLEQEIAGSIKAIQALAPIGKPVKMIMWPGNTSPFESAIKLSRDMGVKNINGGDTRFDREYPSYGWVAPIGKQVGNQLQIYSSNSNENTYTELWTGRFYGFKFLIQTVENTETPLRIKPFNIYYHMYSGEKTASLMAVLQNIEYAEKHEITPIQASNFAGIAEGFYTTQFLPIEDNVWKVMGRGELQTIRFDNAAFLKVDFNKSQGVIGERHYQDSLYVYLDKTVNEPIIAVTKHKDYDQMPEATTVPYLIQSRYPLWDVHYNDEGFSCIGEGFGDVVMEWKMPHSGMYGVEFTSNNHPLERKTLETDENKILHIEFPGGNSGPVHFSIAFLKNNAMP